MSNSVFNDFTALNDLLIPAFKNVALCTQIGEPEWWFDVHAGLKKLARKTCYLCPAFAECRAENDRIETQGAESLYGIFAGEDPRERRARRKAERDGKPASKGGTRANVTHVGGLFSTRTPSDFTKAIG